MSKYEALIALSRTLGCECKEQEPMALHTSFKIGGPADLFLSPENEGQLTQLLTAARQEGLPWMVIGKGSNLLVRDEGIAKVVFHLDERFSALSLESEDVIRCTSGAALSQLCYFAYQNSLAGLEFAWGIPGSVGGAVYMNAGAYGSEMSAVTLWAKHLTKDGELGRLEGAELHFSYRHSAYTENEACILSAAFQLQRGEKDAIKARMDELLKRRKEKQPLEYPSAGSTFKRPVGAYASALIDQCGLKGCRVGDAMVSEKHAGFIVNCGHATCSDVLALVDKVKQEVLKQTGFELECEVKLV